MQTTPTATQAEAPDFADLLARATTEPGIISEAYSRFHAYSKIMCCPWLAASPARRALISPA